MDGHTSGGAYKVTVTFTKDEIDQLTRSMEWAKMMDSHEDTPDHPQRMDFVAHRAFLDGILAKLYDSVIKQRGTNDSKAKTERSRTTSRA